MIEEPLKLIAITPPKYMDISCETSDVLVVVRDCLKVSPK